MPVSSIRDIIKITSEATLMEELAAFEKTLETRIAPIEALLRVDVRAQSNNEQSVEDHMTAIEKFRQDSVRYHALAACFLEHSKSSYFSLKKTKDVTAVEQRAKEKMLVAPFEGLSVRTDGLTRSIDSRVNLCKVLLRLMDEREKNQR